MESKTTFIISIHLLHLCKYHSHLLQFPWFLLCSLAACSERADTLSCLACSVLERISSWTIHWIWFLCWISYLLSKLTAGLNLKYNSVAEHSTNYQRRTLIKKSLRHTEFVMDLYSDTFSHLQKWLDLVLKKQASIPYKFNSGSDTKRQNEFGNVLRKRPIAIFLTELIEFAGSLISQKV